MLTPLKTTTLLFTLLIALGSVNTSFATLESKKDSLLNVIHHTKSQDIKAHAKYRLAQFYFSTSVDTAIQIMDEVVEYAEKAKKNELKAKAYWVMGYLHFNNEDFGKSMRYYLTADKIYRLLQDFNSRQLILDNISDLAIQNGCNDIAIDYGEKRLRLIKHFDDYKIRAHILYAMGIIHNRNKQSLKANRILMKANAVYTNEGSLEDSKVFADVLDELVISQIGLHKKYQYPMYLDSAFYFLDRSLQLDRSDINQAKVYNNMGRVYMLQNKVAEAYRSLYKSLAIKKRINSSRLLISTYNNLGVLHYNNGSLDSAKYYFTVSINENTKPKSAQENLRDDQLHIVFHQHDEVEKSLTYLDSINMIAPIVFTINEKNLQAYKAKQLANDRIAAAIIKDEIQEADRLALKKEQDQLRAANQRKLLLLIILIPTLLSTVAWFLYRYIRNRIAWNKARKEIHQQLKDSGLQVGE